LTFSLNKLVSKGKNNANLSVLIFNLRFLSLPSLDKTLQTLFVQAQNVQRMSHSPYSNFKVGAAILADDSHSYMGCNVENAAYPLGQCAEAGAISAMVAAGAKHIKEILIISPNSDYCPPCGGCRQKISEFAVPSTLIHMANNLGEVTTVSMAELLPYAFDNKSLNK
jgi:cytidine deaminase